MEERKVNCMELQEIIALMKETKAYVGNRERAGHIKTKGRADYVTQVDTDIQSFLARELGSRFPDIQFLGEELNFLKRGSVVASNGKIHEELRGLL